MQFIPFVVVLSLSLLHVKAKAEVTAQQYQVTVKVADELFAGTDADVYVVLYGSVRQCERRLDSSGNDFERGSEKTYAIDCGGDLGWVARIRIGHRNGMWIRGDDWKVSWVRVDDPYRRRQDTYTCNCWLEGSEAHRDLQIPLHGGWSAWSPWSSCSVSCGDGTHSRSRTCSNPPPTNGGNPCSGSSMESGTCNERPCPVDGGWGEWSRWRCDAEPCKIGVGWRNRTCNSPPPSHGGRSCEGPAYEVVNCTLPCRAAADQGKAVFHFAKSAPRDPVISRRWSDWSPCSVRCGEGIQRRHLICSGCSEEREQVRSCHGFPCQMGP